ncbi:MAG: type III-A CRISPR-associated RAMP protein Csm5 [Clostridia bacterium]|nr:type III-A CRISPR-associated RAMP protein Csm5 [Clostridia bacterium]
MQVYEIELEVLSNIHIGNGTKIAKYEYVYDDKQKLYKILDTKKLFDYLVDINKAEDYISFVGGLANNRSNADSNLLFFFTKNVKNYKYILDDYMIYQADNYSNDERLEDIECFIKDKLTNKPYIPGSSLKGALRNAILYSLLELAKKLNELKNVDYLKNEIIARTLKQIMKGISVADSNLIDNASLCVSKIQYLKLNKDQIKSLNQKYEMLKAGTKTKFVMTIDEDKMVDDEGQNDELFNVFLKNFNINFLAKILNNYNLLYEKYYASKFNDGKINNYVNLTKAKDGCSKIYLGAKTGFPNKTIYYQYYKDKAGREVSRIIQENFRNSKTTLNNIDKGISPICLKTVTSNYGLNDMGAVQLSFKEINEL